ncbi:hypothetical protein BC941DRAFT_455333 [Chlamydoabsidia padenii]|nr:hypothetical protein BC941DRAFT_455333 [Chlamydoabsidia padenii]
MSTLALASWPSFTVSPFFTKVNRQHQHDITDETRSDNNEYEPLPNDQFSSSPGLHEDGTLPPALINSIPWRANASDLVSVELLCILDDQFCSKVLGALQTAAQEFTLVVHLKTKLVIRAAYYEFCEHICANDTYGLGAPSSQFTLPFKDGDMNFIYPQALAKQLSPYEYTTSWAYHDVMIELNHDPYMNVINMDTLLKHGDEDGNSYGNNSNNIKWNGTGIPPFGKYWFKGDPAIQPYQIDFEYILLHEILHGMGFVSSWAAYFDNNASPFHTLLDGIFDPADLQFVTPSPYWSVQPPSGPTFVTGFQPNMIFDKFLFITPPTTTPTGSNHTSLMELGFTMQDFCVPGDEAFILHFVRAFQKSTQSQQARRLYSMLTEEHALTFQFGPTLVKNHNSTSNDTYNIVDYLNDVYTHMDLLTGEQTLNALNHHEQSGRLFRPGVTIAHVGNELRDTPDFVMTATYRPGKTLQQWVDEVYATVPVIHYKAALNESTTVDRVYKSPIGPGILRILDALGYVTVLDGGQANYSVPLYNAAGGGGNDTREDDDDDMDGIMTNDNDDDNGLNGNQQQQQPYTSMMKKTKNSHRNVCDDMHGAMATKQKTPTRLSSSSSSSSSTVIKKTLLFMVSFFVIVSYLLLS